MHLSPSSTTVASIDEAPPWTAVASRVVWCQFLYGTAFAAMAALLPKFVVTHLHLRDAVVGHIVTGMAGGVLVGAPLTMALLRRLTRLAVIRLGCALLGLTALAMVFFGEEPNLLLVFAVLAGVSMMLVFNTASSMIADVSPPEHLARSVGWHGASNVVGQAVGPAVAEPLAAHVGWYAAFALAAALALAAYVAAGFLPRDRALGGGGLARGSVRPWLRAVGGLLVISAVCGVAHFAIWAFHQPLAIERGADRLTAYFVGLTAGSLLMRVALGSLPDRLGHARAAFGFFMLYGVVVLATRFVTPPTLGLVGFAQGIAHGAFYPALAALAVLRCPTEQRSATLLFLYASFNVGATLAGVTLGAVAERLGHVRVFDVAGAVTLLAAATLVVPAVRETRARRA